MLNLKSTTKPSWVEAACSQTEELLLDHAHCEKKAAGTAMNLLFAYVDREELARDMADIVREELEHFELVLDLLKRRGIRWRRSIPSEYGARLAALLSKQEPHKAVDRLLVAGLIEARSCERFGLLRDHLPDRELADFYGSLFESEARHHSTYVRLAKLFAPEDAVVARLEVLALHEAEIIAFSGGPLRVHS
ncbi:MAG: tRNA-(ms[2]io[6]A)-hydroxylase [Pirellulales bacterium]